MQHAARYVLRKSSDANSVCVHENPSVKYFLPRWREAEAGAEAGAGVACRNGRGIAKIPAIFCYAVPIDKEVCQVCHIPYVHPPQPTSLGPDMPLSGGQK